MATPDRPRTPRSSAAGGTPRGPATPGAGSSAVARRRLSTRAGSRSSLGGTGTPGSTASGASTPGGASSDPASIRVVARFRPLNKKEIKRGSKFCVEVDPARTDLVKLRTLDGGAHDFHFDRVFGTKSSQQEVYEDAAKPIIADVLQGYNGCLLAYGQTGAGKTHTMSGPSIDDPELMGIIPRMADEVFDFAAQADESTEFEVKCSYVEIYLERLRDLLDPSKDNLRVHEDPEQGVYIKGAVRRAARRPPAPRARLRASRAWLHANPPCLRRPRCT